MGKVAGPLLALLMLAAVPSACAARDFARARAEVGCSDEDLAATIVTLSDGDGPYLEFQVTGLGGGQAPPTLSMTTGPRPQGAASIARATWVDGGTRTALAGTLDLTEVVPGDHLSGRYDLLAPESRKIGSRKITGRFTVPWPHGAAGCG